MIKKAYVLTLKKFDLGSALAMRLVKITGKHSEAVHPKHLIKDKIWFAQYLKKTDRILDLGCGVGFTALKIATKVKEVTGVDVDKKTLEVAKSGSRNIKNIKFRFADANKKLPFKGKSFHKVICSDVLEHLNLRKYALSEIYRVLKDKGILFLVTDNPDTSWKRLQKSVGLFYYADPDHKYEYSKTEILKVLKANNFKIMSVEPVTYDTPLKGLIDLTGGFSLSLYKTLREWKSLMVKRFPQETTGFKIVARKGI